MPFADLNGWRIAYDDAGAGPPVLLVHGLLMDRTMFAPQLQALSDRWRIVAPDTRCHGESEHRAGEPFTQWDLMEDHRALLDHLGIDRAVWGGVSQGGFQAMRAAVRHPDRVAGLILIDTTAEPEDQVRAPLYEAGAQVAAEDGGWDELQLQGALMAMFGESAPEDLKRAWVRRWMAQPIEGSVERMHAVTRREDFRDRLAEVVQPALVVHGEEDLAIEMEEAEGLAAHLPNLVEFVHVPRAGHSSTVENPEPVTASIERFLQKVWPA